MKAVLLMGIVVILSGMVSLRAADAPIPQVRIQTLVVFDTAEVVMPMGVLVTKSGLVVAPDQGAHCLHVWRSDGSLHKVVGRYGKGPGEFEFRNAWPQIDTNGGQVLVLDRDRLHFFDDHDLQFIKTQKFPFDRVRQFQILANGDYLLERYLWDGKVGRYRFQLVIVDARTMEIKKLVHERLDALARRLPNKVTQYRPWGEHLFLDLLPDRKSFAMGVSLSSAFELMSQDGEVCSRVETPFRPRQVTDDEIEHMRMFYMGLERKTQVRNAFTLDTDDQPTFNALMVIPGTGYLAGNYQSYNGKMKARILDRSGVSLAVFNHDFGEMGRMYRSGDRYFVFEIGEEDDWLVREVTLEIPGVSPSP